MRRFLAPSAALAAVLLLAGCGGGGSSNTTTSGTTTSASQSTTEWANGFCGAFATWQSALTPIGQSLTSNPTKENLQNAADDIQSANETLADDLDSLGKPDLPRGEEAQNAVHDLAGEIRGDSDTLSNALGDLSSANEIVSAASTIATTLTQMQTQVQDTVNQLRTIAADSPDSLKNALANASSCKALSNS